MASKPTPAFEADAEHLLCLIQEGSRETSLSSEMLARKFAENPLVATGLRAAIGIAIGNRQLRFQDVAHVLNEAKSECVKSLSRISNPDYRLGDGRLDSWVYGLCKNWVAIAIRNVPPLRSALVKDSDHLDRRSADGEGLAGGRLMSDYQRLLEVIADLPDERKTLKSVLLAWASGLNGSETARELGLTDERVSQLRAEGVTLIRRNFMPRHEA